MQYIYIYIYDVILKWIRGVLASTHSKVAQSQVTIYHLQPVERDANVYIPPQTTDFVLGASSKMYFPRRALQRTPENGVFGKCVGGGGGGGGGG